MNPRYPRSRKTLLKPLAGFGISLMLAAACATEGAAQTRTLGEPYPHTVWNQDPMQQPYAGDPVARLAQERRLKALNDERQKQLVAETNKLVKLTAELNAEINSAHQSELTPEQLRKIADIEKLAHNIRSKMSTSLLGITPNSVEPVTMMPPGEE